MHILQTDGGMFLQYVQYIGSIQQYQNEYSSVWASPLLITFSAQLAKE